MWGGPGGGGESWGGAVLCPLQALKECLVVVTGARGQAGSWRVGSGWFILRKAAPGLGFKQRNDISRFAFSDNHSSCYTQNVGVGSGSGGGPFRGLSGQEVVFPSKFTLHSNYQLN